MKDEDGFKIDIGDAADKRRLRIKAVEGFIRRNSGLHINVLLRLLKYHSGLTERKIREYLDILKDVDKIYERSMKIYIRK